MSRKKQLTSLRNAIFDALGDAVDIKEIMNSLGGLSIGDIKTLRNQLKTTEDAISVLKKYDAISKYLSSRKPGEVRYGSTYTPIEYRKKNVTLEAFSRFYANQSAEEYLKKSKERREEQWNRFSENSKKFYEELEANRPLSSIRDTSVPSGISYGSDLDDITYRTDEQEALRDDYRRRELQTIENKERRHEANRLARERYRDSMREIRDPSHIRRRSLYESFLEVDESTGKSSFDQRKAAANKAREVLAAEKANTKGVNENTKALFGLRALLGPYAKAVMPFYGAKMFYDLTKSDTSASLARVNRRTFGGLYGASGNPRRGYRRMFDAMTSYGASEQDVIREYAGQKKWASTLMFGMGLDKIEALAMVLGKAPGPAEMRDPELMQRWLRENMRGITDMQALQLSSMGVASDAFIESARKGQAVDTEGETARIHSKYKSLYEQQGGWENPFRKIQFGIGRDNANAIAEGSLTGFIYEFEMDVLRKLGNVWGALFSKNETGTTSPRDEYGIIPRQTSVTVNINGNIDSEERAHSFAEQIGAEVSNAEK